MATYNEIYGKRVEVFDSDPTLSSAYEGQVWYNSTSGVLKSVVSSASAVSAQAMPTGTRAYGSIGATQNAFMVACGANPGTNYSGNVYEYNGIGWVTKTSASNPRDQVSRGTCGTVTAGLVFGGTGPGVIRADTELWNGTAWTESGNLSDSRGGGESFGTQTACVTTGGYNDFSPPYWTNATEEFNGSSWTSGTATPLNTNQGCGVGIETAGMIVGQREQPSNLYPSAAAVTQTRNYDGTNWTAGGILNMAANANFTAGSQTAARKAGGASPAPASYTNTEEWDNTSWTTGPALASDLSNGGGAGTSTAAVYAGGQTPPGNLTTVQEVNKSIATISAAAWASGGTLNTARYFGGSAGIQTAALYMGGEAGPGATGATELYNGSTWTTSPATIPSGKNYAASGGTQTAAYYAGGSPVVNTSYNFNGSAWTTSPGTLNTGRFFASVNMGTQTAGVAISGYGTPSKSTAYEQYNGSTWTASPYSVSTGRQQYGGAGTQTAMFISGGETPSVVNSTEENTGSAWTSGTNMPVTATDMFASGTLTAAVVSGFRTSPSVTTTLTYDGTSWGTAPSMANTYFAGGSGGTQSAAIAFGGATPAPATTDVTEEWSTGIETINAKTLTTS